MIQNVAEMSQEDHISGERFLSAPGQEGSVC